LIIVENLPVPFDRRVWNEAKTLQQAGYYVTVICPRGKGHRRRHEVIEGVHIYRHPLPEASGAVGYIVEYMCALFWQVVLSAVVFWRHGFDAIHACNPPDLIFLPASIFKYCFGTKFVFDHHDLNPELYEAKFGRRDFMYRLLVFLERRTFALADICIATNASYRQIAISRGSKHPDQVCVVRSGPNLDRLVIGPPSPELRHGKRYLVGYIGVIGRQEGVDRLIGVVAELVRQYGRRDTHFTIIGSGPDLARVMQLVDTMHLTEFVTFMGYCTDEEVLAILNTADVCVNSDIHCELNDKSTMNKIMEYMALGKPIVQFDSTEGRASAAGASLYAEPENVADFTKKLLCLLDNAELRNEMGQLGRRRVETELAWPYEARKLLAAYAQIQDRPLSLPDMQRSTGD
jgi:glycosyltransferase involved in cell wall biosynthesis